MRLASSRVGISRKTRDQLEQSSWGSGQLVGWAPLESRKHANDLIADQGPVPRAVGCPLVQARFGWRLQLGSVITDRP
jgi:hypothetical protein